MRKTSIDRIISYRPIYLTKSSINRDYLSITQYDKNYVSEDNTYIKILKLYFSDYVFQNMTGHCPTPTNFHMRLFDRHEKYMHCCKKIKR